MILTIPIWIKFGRKVEILFDFVWIDALKDFHSFRRSSISNACFSMPLTFFRIFCGLSNFTFYSSWTWVDWLNWSCLFFLIACKYLFFFSFLRDTANFSALTMGSATLGFRKFDVSVWFDWYWLSKLKF